ncbi:MAG: Tim44-like domain-containing protein [Clostridia bacterium]
MKKCRTIIKFIVFCTLISLIFLPTYILADVGNINRYDGSDGFGSFFDFNSFSGNDNLSYYDPSYISYSGQSYDLIFTVIFIFIIVVISILYKMYKTKKMGEFPNPDNVPNFYDETKYIGQLIRKNDVNFSDEKFISWVKTVFIKLQQAWTDRNWHIIRPFESNELFEQHSIQLQEYIDNGKINVIENISVEYAQIINYRIDGDMEIIVIELQAVMNDYVIDEITKKILDGDKTRDWHMKYKMVFARKNGVKTQTLTSNKSTTNCPNCGAPTQITSSGQCEYCCSIITTGEHDWVLTKLEKL